MKKKLFLFAVFFMLAVAGCASVADNPTPQRQDFNSGSGKHTGLPQRMGAALQDGQSSWPGDTVNKGAANVTGGAGIAARTADQAGAAGELLAAGQSGAGAVAGRDITLLNLKSPVSRGGTGSLSIQGEPDVSYNITSVFSYSGRTITATVAKKAGADGKVSWTWDVGKDTAPGTYGVMVTGGGKLLTTVYTVR